MWTYWSRTGGEEKLIFYFHPYARTRVFIATNEERNMKHENKVKMPPLQKKIIPVSKMIK